MNKSKEYWDVKEAQKEILALKLHNRHLLNRLDISNDRYKDVEKRLFEQRVENNRLRDVIERLKQSETGSRA